MSDIERDETKVPESEGTQAGSIVVTVFAAWLVPGAGHYLLGKRFRAIGFAILIFVALAIGVSLQGNLHRMLPEQPLTLLSTLGSMGVGAAYFVLRYFAAYQGDVMAAGYEYGSAFILTAGLMNLLLVLDALDIARGKKE